MSDTGRARADEVATAATHPAARIPERIVVAAARVMERDGYDGASVREIAAEAGVSKPGLYYHAPSKDHLLFAIHHRFATQLIDHAEEVLASDRSPEAKLRELIRLNIATIASYRAESTVFLREYWHLTGELRRVVDDQRDRYRDIYEEVLAAGQAAGVFVAGDVRLDALAVLGACNFTGVWFDPEGPLDADKIAEVFADRLLGGLTAAASDPTTGTGGAS